MRSKFKKKITALFLLFAMLITSFTAFAGDSSQIVTSTSGGSVPKQWKFGFTVVYVGGPYNYSFNANQPEYVKFDSGYMNIIIFVAGPNNIAARPEYTRVYQMNYSTTKTTAGTGVTGKATVIYYVSDELYGTATRTLYN